MTIFSKIIQGELPCYKIAEDENHFAFLDTSPIVRGHTLALPKQEINYLFDLENEAYKEFMLFVKKISLAVEKSIVCKRIGIMSIGLEVPHAHIHIIPLKTEKDMDIRNKKFHFTEEEFENVAADIRKNIV